MSAKNEVEEKWRACSCPRLLTIPGIPMTDKVISKAICLEAELTRKVKAVVRIVLGGLSTAALYLISLQVNTGGRLSITLHILLILSTVVLAWNAVILPAAELRMREHRKRFLTYLSYIRQDLGRRGLAFEDEAASIRNLSKSLIRIPIGPVNAETMATLQAMEREEAASSYRQFGEIKQI